MIFKAVCNDVILHKTLVFNVQAESEDLAREKVAVMFGPNLMVKKLEELTDEDAE